MVKRKFGTGKKIWNIGASKEKNKGRKMGRKERCPNCSSKKVDVYSVPKKCRVCGFTWTGKGRVKAPKKDKVRF